MDKDTAKLDDLIDLVKRTRADKNLFVTVDELEWCLSQVAALTATLRKAIDKIESLQAEVTRLREEAEWISVEDRLPEQDVEVLFYWKHEGVQVDCIEDKDNPLDWLHPPTHWKPLPPPPNNGK